MKTNKFTLVALLAFGMFINAIDRGALGVAAPQMLKDLNMDPGVMGIALSAFYCSYILCMIPVGRLADKYGAKTALGWAAAFWSVASAATGLIQGFYGLIAVRLGVGAGETAGNPLSAKVINENFPSAERARATAWCLSGTKLGMAAVPVIMGFLMTWWSWRTAFLVTGIGSLLWCLAWYVLFREQKRDTAGEEGTKPGSMPIPWKKLLSNRTILGLMLTKFFLDYLWVVFISWLPSYLVMERGFSFLKMGLYASIPWIVGFIAQPAMGHFSDWLIKKGVSVTKARKYALVGSQAVAASVIAVGFVDDPLIAVILLTINIAGESASAGIMWTILTEVSPKGMGGTVASAVNTVSSIAGVMAPTITGFIYKFTGSFQLALLVAGVGILISAMSMLFVVQEIKPVDLATKG
ncbi:MFS transporter [Herbaspirillum sp.]|uniref:MFS transporter n=1 Tax=Herbaspirillum sp. TaxID=1890675 RepID=UPI0031D1E499